MPNLNVRGFDAGLLLLCKRAALDEGKTLRDWVIGMLEREVTARYGKPKGRGTKEEGKVYKGETLQGTAAPPKETVYAPIED